ncbi:DUF1761 domain-containing protein [Luteimonas terricola]|uniref:DUF1761 domain-containing protein n=1 Tax=Luteimonas terricola TaxID=645597 RepID=A0ABQ2EB58_9GAMM|nr:DUF1761 domain-containing protein [Luteimonas terricola]GGK03925.1 hypothetical protein GCM10011394_11120 [Luteimonas terricola]
MNIWIVLAAAASSFLVGGLWYSPALFGKVWTVENGSQMAAGHPAKVFGVSFAFSLVAAAAFAVLVGPSPGLEASVKLGALTGIGLVAASYGINYQFAQRSLKLWLIDGGYHAVQFLLFGVVFGLWG